MGRSITVGNGATLTGSAEIWGSASVTINGNGSRWDAGYLEMNADAGEIIVSEGGLLHGSGIAVGSRAGEFNKILVTGDGSPGSFASPQ